MHRFFRLRQFCLYVLLVWMVLPLTAEADVTHRVDLDLVKAWIMEDEESMGEDAEMAFEAYRQISEDELADYARRCNNYRVRLYSCKENRLFETTMYLRLVKDLYKELEEKAQPNNEVIDLANRDIMRYQLLLQTLRSMPPAIEDDSLDEGVSAMIADSIELLENDTLLHHLMTLVGDGKSFYILTQREQLTRDTCIMLAKEYVRELEVFQNYLLRNSEGYAKLRDEFASTAHFAEERYDLIREEIHKGSITQYSLVQMLANPAGTIEECKTECHDKYAHIDKIFTVREVWIVLGEMLCSLGLSILIIWLIRKFTAKRPDLFPRTKKNPAIFANLLYMLVLLLAMLIDVKICHLPLVTLNAEAFLVYITYILMLQVSLLIREEGDRAANAMHLYVPVITLGFFVVFMRMFFVPDIVLIMLTCPMSLICLIWETTVMGRYWNKVSNVDSTISAVTMLVMLSMTIASACGYVFLSIEIFFWWQAQQAAIAVVIGLHFLMKHLMPRLDKRKVTYMEKTTGKQVEKVPEYLIQVTWLDDLIQMVAIPLLGILTVPLCIYAALGFFNGGAEFVTFFHKTIYSLGESDKIVFDLSLYNITLSASLYFVFRYLRHVASAIYTQLRIRSEKQRQGRSEIETNQVNLALGTKVVSIIVWGLYICAVCVIFRLPLQSLTVVAAGMAAGLSFAMQDILNNFFYGMQLMAGRLRMGDYIICDNYRGTVTSISYQTTQICTETGADVCFTNKDLFSKNFQNLTKQNPYEVNRVYFDVAYGSDIEKVEKITLGVIESLNRKDKYGRILIRMSDVRVEMSNLASSGITMGLRFAVLAEKMTWFMPVLRREIYRKLEQENIDIPFDQLDIRIKNNE